MTIRVVNAGFKRAMNDEAKSVKSVSAAHDRFTLSVVTYVAPNHKRFQRRCVAITKPKGFSY